MSYGKSREGRPLKVAFPFVTMPVGGAEDLFLSVARHLPPEVEPHFVCLRSLGMLGEEAAESGLAVHLVPVFPTKRVNPFGILKLARWFRDQEIGLVHAQTYHDQLFGVAAGRLAGIPTVVHQHKTLTALGGRKGFFMRRVFRAADHVVALSEETRLDLIGALSLDEGRVSSLPNAVDLSIFHPAADRMSVRDGLGVGRSEFLVGSVASLHPTKNHPATLGALALLPRRDIPPLRCMIFGEGADRAMLEELIVTNRLEGRVQLAGRKRPIAPWIQSLDLFVLPSHWEGQPMAILQALACRIPILASRIEGNVALLGPGHPGLFEPEDHRGYAMLIEKAATSEEFSASLLAHQDALAVPSLQKLSETLAALYLRLSGRSPSV